MAEDVIFEHKHWNAEIAACKTAADLHPMYRIQMEQQLMVSGAKRCLFMATDWAAFVLTNRCEFWYESDPKLRKEIGLGWIQFKKDVADYTPVEVKPAGVAKVVLSLPAVAIQVGGAVDITTNMALFGKALEQYIEGIPKAPETDDDFATCKAAVKTLKEAEEALDAAEANALAQVSSIDDMKRNKKLLTDLARNTRLALDKLVVAQEKAIKEKIVGAGREAFAAHLGSLNTRLGKPYMPPVPVNFEGAIKSKRTIASLQDAVDTELARAKIAANAVADATQVNLNYLREHAKDHAFLFADAGHIVLKAADDFEILVKARIAEHVKAETDKAEQKRLQDAAKPPVPAAPVQVTSAPPQVGASRVPTGTVDLRRIPDAPTKQEIIGILAQHYNVPTTLIVSWLACMDFELHPQ